MKKVFPILCAAILTMTMFCCSSERMNDPVGAEVILIPSIDDTSGNDWYDPYHEFTDRDGFKSIGFEPYDSSDPFYYVLYSPAGNLKMALAGCSQCGELYGFEIEYDESGMVKDVIEIVDRNYYQSGESMGYFALLSNNDDNTSILRKWMKDKSCKGNHFPIVRDENGQPERIGDIYVPYGYSAKYSIEEWGPFSGSDLAEDNYVSSSIWRNKTKPEEARSITYILTANWQRSSPTGTGSSSRRCTTTMDIMTESITIATRMSFGKPSFMREAVNWRLPGTLTGTDSFIHDA